MALLTEAQIADLVPDITPAVLKRCRDYITLLEKWQRAINLVGRNTLADPWRRHILDSVQLKAFIPPHKRIVDLGSGAGLPGLILGVAGFGPVELVESDQRKCAFLREVVRTLDLDVTVHAQRIEELDPLQAPVITARALAPLKTLLPWVHRHIANDGKAVLLKGKSVEDELTETAKNWKMRLQKFDSLSDSEGTVLVIEKLEPHHVG